MQGILFNKASRKRECQETAENATNQVQNVAPPCGPCRHVRSVCIQGICPPHSAPHTQPPRTYVYPGQAAHVSTLLLSPGTFPESAALRVSTSFISTPFQDPEPASRPLLHDCTSLSFSPEANPQAQQHKMADATHRHLTTPRLASAVTEQRARTASSTLHVQLVTSRA